MLTSHIQKQVPGPISTVLLPQANDLDLVLMRCNLRCNVRCDENHNMSEQEGDDVFGKKMLMCGEHVLFEAKNKTCFCFRLLKHREFPIEKETAGRAIPMSS